MGDGALHLVLHTVLNTLLIKSKCFCIPCIKGEGRAKLDHSRNCAGCLVVWSILGLTSLLIAFPSPDSTPIDNKFIIYNGGPNLCSTVEFDAKSQFGDADNGTIPGVNCGGESTR